MGPFLFSRPLLFIFSVLISCSCLAQKKLVVLGDSLVEGYGVARESAFPALLEKKLKENGKAWSVVNSGVSGSTTASAASRLNWIFKTKPDAIMLVLGANDGLRGLKVEKSQANLEAAVELIRKNKIQVILGGLYMPPNYGKEYTEQFRKMYSSVAKKYSIPFIPFILEKVAGDPKMNLADGIHPNEKGHRVIADHVYEAIKGVL